MVMPSSHARRTVRAQSGQSSHQSSSMMAPSVTTNVPTAMPVPVPAATPAYFWRTASIFPCSGALGRIETSDWFEAGGTVVSGESFELRPFPEHPLAGNHEEQKQEIEWGRP